VAGGRGSLLLLAAAHETGLIEALDAALPLASPTCPTRLVHSTRASRERSLLTLLFLNAMGVRRTWELRSYTGAGLAILSRRQRAYSYRHTERFLSQVAHAGGDEPLTEALAAWTSKLWPSEAPEPGQPPPAFYLDGHRKPVYPGRTPGSPGQAASSSRLWKPAPTLLSHGWGLCY
jgi:hypothetical protein